jgi:hypothetical protein
MYICAYLSVYIHGMTPVSYPLHHFSFLSLITNHILLISYHSSLISYRSSLIAHLLSLITHHSSLITYHLSLITHIIVDDALVRVGCGVKGNILVRGPPCFGGTYVANCTVVHVTVHVVRYNYLRYS